MFYRFARFIVKVIFKIMFRIEVIGTENIPKKGPVIICSNHISNYDPPVVGITSPRSIDFMAKEELFEKKWLNVLLSNLNAFPVKRGMRDRNALRTGIERLEKGHTLGLFPEGTRSKNGEVKKGLAGAGFFAMRSNATVIPCAIIGSYEKFSKLQVVYGRPIEFKTLEKEKPGAQEVTDEIMGNIKSLLDEHR
ncbi:lysophospholipid acyltransferase family protein [Aquisalibacillus elongatus]|uniref:1-acyl-sn-glycerol-3-phosphate acyltransferase n=1 Tax=Aquisalibacillus elongatus TaxID=485577 RepID=A0A3N5BDI5_9BACI|nr:lysophospholipid acyltransferase family protein [Aquisalibacillus elongatus]RPF55756.1 1-acyl-sn-glycerol-3-phosphate acyltransferase [Aquisalibacillus elongatus]